MRLGRTTASLGQGSRHFTCVSVGSGLSWAYGALEEGQRCWVGEEPVSEAAPSSGPKSWDKWLGADRCKQFRGTWGAADSNRKLCSSSPRLAWVGSKASKGRHTSWPRLSQST